jgi:uncharacterized sporulation protein YeaH/YhbH (DUF444 family)
MQKIESVVADTEDVDERVVAEGEEDGRDHVQSGEDSGTSSEGGDDRGTVSAMPWENKAVGDVANDICQKQQSLES